LGLPLGVAYDNSTLISEDLHISDHVEKHRKPINDNEFGYYLAGLIEGDGYFGDHYLEMVFHNDDAFLAYYIKKRIGYGSVLKLKGNNSVKYVLRHSEGLKYVLTLVNGKLLTSNKIIQLLNHGYDKKLGTTVLPPATFDLTTNHWLAGYSDAQGTRASFEITIANSHLRGDTKYRPIYKDNFMNRRKLSDLVSTSCRSYPTDSYKYNGISKRDVAKGIHSYLGAKTSLRRMPTALYSY